MKQPPGRRLTASSSETDSTRPRVAGVLLVVTGLVHLLAPTTLLNLAGWSYRTVLDVEFDPNPGASGRVRAIGLGFVAAGAHLLYHDGVVPGDG